MHQHTHSHHHHHEHGAERRLLWALLLTGSFMVAEVIGGLMSGSLALLADAGHMLTDSASLALAWAAARAARRPADALRSYGYHRAQVLAALINGVAFIAIVVWIVAEAVQRLLEPVPVLGGMMLVVAVLGLLVNVAAFFLLHGGDHGNLNVQGAVLHVLGDLLGSVAAIVAAGVILLSGWTPIDPLLSVLVAALILRSAWVLVRKSGHILLEGTPEGVDLDLLRAALHDAVPEVRDVHHVHVWSLTPQRPLLTMHVEVSTEVDHTQVLARIKGVLEQQFGIDHSTVQIECGPCVDE